MGEAEFGLMQGVYATSAGWIGGSEVVQLRFDPNEIPYAELLRAAQSHDCARQVFALGDEQLETARKAVGESAITARLDQFRVDQEPKYYLRQSAYRHVPMTELQAMRINAALGKRQQVDADLLSPGQKLILKEVSNKDEQKWPVLVGVDVAEAWAAMRAYPR
ncbi:MAG: hypothetical protein ACYTG5_18420 [Planctomycetota bacterium]